MTPTYWPFVGEKEFVVMRLILIGGFVLLLLIGFVGFVLVPR